ncbi:hypothetical protein ISF_04808 [Cordyceps fumosorosea ARSEF 2679]|uniref:AoPex11B-like protein n=1 Tax=Cordyceps fumosorosea (strain ARSEF 2679) TaxID=1081104 RepID=A0A162J2P3_CORFA|nr:hypothetical protein ISF_04808 [Cordyceps fumosorosea ARSEF 2679]OAA62932.1 hypothetical protein ISF_04808 [Cordyceps fumosorosea ARSEF 2679]
MAKTIETFVAFGADIFALERMMRLLQAVGMVFTSYSFLIALARPSASAAHHLATRLALVALQDWLNVTRRALRTFWFLRAFHGSYAQYQSLASAPGVEDLLDVVAGSLLGMFGLLETVTLPDVTRLPGLAVFGAEETRRLNVQAQACWLAALVAMVLAGGVRVLRLLAERAVPTGADFGGGGGGVGDDDAEEEGGKGGKKGAASEKKKKKRDAERKRKLDKAEAARKTRVQVRALTLKMVNDALDMVIPANICGLSEFHPGQVGIAMAVTSLITLRGHWERCAKTLQ